MTKPILPVALWSGAAPTTPPRPAFHPSPEQLRGHPFAPSSAVYSLGMVLAEMLCGAPYTHVKEEVRIAMRVRGIPLPRSLDPSLPAPVLALVNSMLATTPSRRPSLKDVSELAGALAVALQRVVPKHAPLSTLVQSIQAPRPPQCALPFGRFMLLRLLGSLGPNSTWLAQWQDGGTARDVVLHHAETIVRRPHMAGPGVLHALCTGDSPNGSFMAEQLAAGPSLDRVLVATQRLGTRLPLDDVLGITEGAARALDAAFSQGAAHHAVGAKHMFVTLEGTLLVGRFSVHETGRPQVPHVQEQARFPSPSQAR